MTRPILPSRSAPLVMLTLTCVVAMGCASSEGARREQERQARDARPSNIQPATYEDDDASPQMTVQGEEGTLNNADVESALHDHVGEIRDCYRASRKGAPKAEGRVVVRFFVDGKGEVDDVSIVESTIGNHAVERCIADIAVGVVFERPAGHKPMTFDYPFEFRSARELTADRQRKP